MTVFRKNRERRLKEFGSPGFMCPRQSPPRRLLMAIPISIHAASCTILNMSNADEKEKDIAIPRCFRFAHILCFYLHDSLATMVQRCDDLGLFSVDLDLTLESEAESLDASEDTWEWLEGNGHESVLDEIVRRNVIGGLVTDMCHYLYEGLRCSEKGKLTVAYSLLRKHLKENLFYLEWLLADPGDFLHRFRSRENLDVDYQKVFPSEEQKLAVIRKAMQTTNWGGASGNRFGVRSSIQEES